jgi:hypothetical protein
MDPGWLSQSLYVKRSHAHRLNFKDTKQERDMVLTANCKAYYNTKEAVEQIPEWQAALADEKM